jgi:hypothetical protein
MSPARFIIMLHRSTLVQFRQRGAIKTLLFNPTDIDASRRTPYFAKIIAKIGWSERYLRKTYDPLEVQLARLGFAPENIDYIAFDHFHTQDIRPLVGTRDGRLKARFPNAQLLAPRNEWDDWDHLHPMQAAWFVADGKQDAREDRIVFTSSDLALGDGVMLLRTPGHTSGNQTLFFKTDRGVWGISENGVAADNWAPKASRISGVAAIARHQGLDAVLNSNTIESGADQYTSMMLERTLVDPVAARPEFFQMFPSSECESSILAPGLAPTYAHNDLSFGELVAPGARRDMDVTRPPAGPAQPSV